MEENKTITSTTPTKNSGGPRQDKKDSWWDIVKFVLITLAIVIPIRAFVAQPFIVSGLSMYPTFNNSDYLIVDELSYHLRTPVRGEVIIFEYPLDPAKYFIKRVIGLPGEIVRISGSQISISADGKTFRYTESYLSKGVTTNPAVVRTLGPDEYFVLGDNRKDSFDSRYWGVLNIKYIKGRAYLRLFPLTQIGYLPGNYNWQEGSNGE
mgnify:FL=1